MKSLCLPIEITATQGSQGRQGDIWTLLHLLSQPLKNINALPQHMHNSACSPRMRYETAVLNRILSISFFTVIYRELPINYYKLTIYTVKHRHTTNKLYVMQYLLNSFFYVFGRSLSKNTQVQ